MITALVSKQFVARFGDALKAVGQRAGKPVAFLTLPEEQGARLAQADCERIDCTFVDRDIRFNEHLCDCSQRDRHGRFAAASR